MRAGVQGGSNVRDTSTRSTLGIPSTARRTQSTITSWSGQPGAVSVMVMRTVREGRDRGQREEQREGAGSGRGGCWGLGGGGGRGGDGGVGGRRGRGGPGVGWWGLGVRGRCVGRRLGRLGGVVVVVGAGGRGAG